MTSADDSLDENELTSLLKLLEAEQSRAHLLMNVVIPIGVALAHEQDLDRLLDRIVNDAMNLCCADLGTLHLLGSEGELKQAIVKTRRKATATTDDTDRTANGNRAAAMASTSGELINLPEFTPTSDADARPRSCLAIPLRSNDGRVIGVVELGDARGEDGEICPFEPGIQQVVESLCKLAAVALESYLQQQKLKNQVRDLTIQIDESKKTRQVREIVETSYFKTLKSRARELRAQNATVP